MSPVTIEFAICHEISQTSFHPTSHALTVLDFFKQQSNEPLEEEIDYTIPEGLTHEQYQRIFLSAPEGFHTFLNRNLDPKMLSDSELKDRTALSREEFEASVERFTPAKVYSTMLTLEAQVICVWNIF